MICRRILCSGVKVRCQVGILENRFCVILQNMSECQHCHMSALSESRRGACIDFSINTDRSLFPQEDITNDIHVIWFEAETRGILVEEGFRLISSQRFFLIVVRNTSYHNYTYFAQSGLYIILIVRLHVIVRALSS